MVVIEELSPQHKQMLRDRMDAAKRLDDSDECCMSESFQKLQEAAPDFLQQRIASFSDVLAMSTDPAWDLPLLDRTRVFSAGKYLKQLDQSKLSCIETAVLGALALDLVASDMHSELDLYQEFLAFKQDRGIELTRPEWLRHKRAESLSQKRSFFGLRRSNVGMPGAA